MAQADGHPGGTANVLLAVDRHPDPPGDRLRQGPPNRTDGALDVGRSRRLASPFPSGVRQLQLGSGHDHDLNGGQQDQKDEGEDQGELD